MVISRMIVAATTNRTIGRFAARKSSDRLAEQDDDRDQPDRQRPAAAGRAVKMTLPGSVSRPQDRG